jgi:hypothetical protein
VLKKGASHPISRELITTNHELTRAKLVPVPVFQQPAKEGATHYDKGDYLVYNQADEGDA